MIKIARKLKYHLHNEGLIAAYRTRSLLARFGNKPLPLYFSAKRDWERVIRKSLLNSPYQAIFLKDLNKLPEQGRGIVLPLSIEQTHVANRLKSRGSGSYQFLQPESALVDLCDDKAAFARRLSSEGLSALQPKVYRSIDEAAFPCVLKKAVDQFGENAHILRKPEDYEALSLPNAEEYILQECLLDCSEYAVHFYRDEAARIVFVKSVRYDYSETAYIKGKNGVEQGRYYTDDFVCEAQLSDLLDKLNYVGIGCLNFKIVDGLPKVFEINPRLGASMTFIVDELISAVEAE